MEHVPISGHEIPPFLKDCPSFELSLVGVYGNLKRNYAESILINAHYSI